MKHSKLFLKTAKTPPSDETSINARLLEQGGFIQKVMAGVYTFLPIGWRVLSKIENIVREEMNAIGGQEMFMPSLHPKESWQTTGRWESLDVLFKIKSQHGYEYALGPTHEEIVTPAALPIINSYKDLPLAVYQIQTKFRDEPRAKSGLMRGREFRMKDLYSYHTDETDLGNYYKVASEAYTRIFKRMGLDSIFTEASGGTFSANSHEYQVEIESGEDTIYVCEKCGIGKNKEIFKEGVECSNCGKTTWREIKASEVGNIFQLNTKYSLPFNLMFTALDGSKKEVMMGCYGIGTSRLMGVLVEKFHDEKGIIWPEIVAPFKIHLLALKGSEEQAEQIYQDLLKQKIEVLYDDRDVSAGVKFADADLIGLPYRIVVSAKTLASDSVEIKKRDEEKQDLIKTKELMTRFVI
jgi:prolyl-tRNA synthetase